ncbi:hypothetical protein MCEJIRE27_00396 [Candidatus Nanopelagicaceae bacterium]
MVAKFVTRRPKYFISALVLFTLTLGLPTAHAVQPTVLNVSSTTSNGVYGVGDVIEITIQFSQNVYVTGTPILTLQPVVGSNTNTSYFSGSGTDTLVFRLTSPAGSNSADLDYASTSALSGTIKNAAGEFAILTLAAPGSTGSLSSNKAISFEYFGSHVAGVSSSDSGHMSNSAYSSLLGGVLTSNGNNIVLLNTADDTRTVILNTGASVNNLQVFGDYMYWTAGSNFYKSPLISPLKSTILTHTAMIADFVRTANYWAFIDSNRVLYRMSIDGNFTKTAVTTLSTSIVDYPYSYNMMYLSPNADKIIWISINSSVVSEIDVASGATSTYANISKCTTSPRGMMRLQDGSEYYFSYSPTSTVTHRWPDGRISCAATSFSPWMMGGGTTDGTYVFITTYSSSSADYRISRYTPTNVTWYPLSSYDPTAAPTSTSVSTPALNPSVRYITKGITATVQVSTSVDGRATFLANGKRIGNCINISTNSLVASCSFKATIQGSISIIAIFTPSASGYASSTSSPLVTSVVRRTTTR